MGEADHSQEAKWDWDLVKALYIAGMSHAQIVRLPNFIGLSKNFLAKKCSDKGWTQARNLARTQAVGEIPKTLIEKMGEAEEIHQNFLLNVLKNERDVFNREFNKAGGNKGGKFQVERLAALERIDTITRRQLGLDERKALDANQRNLGILISLQSNGGPRPKVDGVNVQLMFGDESENIPKEKQIEAIEILQEHEAREKSRYN